MADYILYDGQYSGEQIDAFLSRVEKTPGTGPLQAELAGVQAKELPYDQYMAVEKQVEADGSVSLILGVPRGKDGVDGAVGPPGPQGIPGTAAEKGATFTPSVSASGDLSWTNDAGLENPETVNIMGPQGEAGDKGATGPQGPQGGPGPQGPKGDPGDGVPSGGTAGQVLTKTESGTEWQDPTGGVTSFNGRGGAVVPAAGDYTAAQVGAIPASEKGVAGGVAAYDATVEALSNKLNTYGRGVNLLDNWYFANPVNQRGQTEYTAQGYTIDRWISNGIIIKDGYLEAPSSGCWILQRLEDSVKSAMDGKTLTFSALTNAGLVSGSTVYRASDAWVYFYTDADIQLYVNTLGEVAGYFLSTSKKLAAVKLELGDTQTLAHQDADGNWVLNDPPPDYGTELAKCQRYQVEANIFGRQYATVGIGQALTSNTIYMRVPLPVPMRANPIVNFSGKWTLNNGSTFVGTVANMEVDNNSSSAMFLTVKCVMSDNVMTARDIYLLTSNADMSARLLLDANL